MNPRYRQYLDTAQSKKKANKKLLERLKKMKPKVLDKLIHEIHELAFEEIDCLECANCCKSISPSVKDRDVERIAKALNMKPSGVVSKYMLVDVDDDYVMNTSPCPFLQSDNCCSVYDSRPLACKGYPHTDRSKMYQILDLTLKNTKICPAVCFVIEEIHKLVK